MHDTPFHQSLRITSRLTLIAFITLAAATLQLFYSQYQIDIADVTPNTVNIYNLSKSIMILSAVAVGLGFFLMCILDKRIEEHERFRFTHEPTQKVFSILLTRSQHSLLSLGLLILAPWTLIYPSIIPKLSGDFFWHSELFSFSPLWAFPICIFFSYLFAKKANSNALRIFLKLIFYTCLCFLAIGFIFFVIACMTFTPFT